MRFVPWWLRLVAAAAVVGALATSSADVRLAAATIAAVILVVAVYRRLRRRRIRSWRDAELATARWLRRMGCRRVRLTGGSADGGIDVFTSEWAVQVKHTEKRVGRPAVQQLVGAALSLDLRPALFSTSGFSGPACAYADDHEVALFELDLRGRAHGVNGPARQVGSRLRRLTRS